MSRNLFRSILMVALVTLLVTLLLLTACMYDYFGGMQEKQLLDALGLAARGTELSGEVFLSSLPTDRYRLTWIASDGTVLFDSRTDVAAMENHSDRAEVKAALATGAGSSSRYSTTLTEKTLYKAEKLSDGTVLRISCSRATAAILLLGMVQPVLLVAIVSVVLSAVLSKRLAIPA